MYSFTPPEMSRSSPVLSYGREKAAVDAANNVMIAAVIIFFMQIPQWLSRIFSPPS